MEIAVYQKLLEGEEDRLGLSQHSSPVSDTPQPGRGIKRKRTVYDEEETTQVQSCINIFLRRRGGGQINIIITHAD
jgi:hypothetical protein